MDSEENLYKELVQLRKKLREEHTAENGKAPQICSDEALMEMARRMPTKLEDLTAIDGIGQRFAEVYGNSFLAVTRRYAVTAAKGAKLDDGVAGTLRELQKKLVNVSKGNRLLFMPRTGAKSSYDLTITVQSGEAVIPGAEAVREGQNAQIRAEAFELDGEHAGEVQGAHVNALCHGSGVAEGALGEDIHMNAPATILFDQFGEFFRTHIIRMTVWLLMAEL